MIISDFATFTAAELRVAAREYADELWPQGSADGSNQRHAARNFFGEALERAYERQRGMKRAVSLRRGDKIMREPYGVCRVVSNRESGSRLRKIEWMPVEDSWRVVNPPGLDYIADTALVTLG